MRGNWYELTPERVRKRTKEVAYVEFLPKQKGVEAAEKKEDGGSWIPCIIIPAAVFGIAYLMIYAFSRGAGI